MYYLLKTSNCGQSFKVLECKFERKKYSNTFLSRYLKYLNLNTVENELENNILNILSKYMYLKSNPFFYSFCIQFRTMFYILCNIIILYYIPKL